MHRKKQEPFRATLRCDVGQEKLLQWTRVHKPRWVNHLGQKMLDCIFFFYFRFCFTVVSNVILLFRILSFRKLVTFVNEIFHCLKSRTPSSSCCTNSIWICHAVRVTFPELVPWESKDSKCKRSIHHF